MSSTIKVKPEQFQNALRKAMMDYGDKVYDIAEVASKNSARQTTRDLKANGPSGGPYARGWTHKKQGNGLTSYSETVHNRIYQLTHLLEKPHTTGHGGKYPSEKDHTGQIARVEEANAQKFMMEVLSKL